MGGLSVSMVTEAGGYGAVSKFLCVCVCVVSRIPGWQPPRDAAALASLKHRSCRPEPNSDSKAFAEAFPPQVGMWGLTSTQTWEDAALLGGNPRNQPDISEYISCWVFFPHASEFMKSLKYPLQRRWLWNVDQGGLNKLATVQFHTHLFVLCSPAAWYLSVMTSSLQFGATDTNISEL